MSRIMTYVHTKYVYRKEALEFAKNAGYVGSANLTGAGIGMKGENTRNFEAGVLSSNKEFVKNAAEQFDSVWMGSFCKSCKRKEFCSDPIV